MQPWRDSPHSTALAGMIAMVAAMGIGRFVYTPILPDMMEALGQTTSQAGFIAAANYAGYLIGALIAGGGWAHGLERALALAGVALSAALALAMAATDELAAFLAIRFAAGLASAFVMVFMASIVFHALATRGRADLQWVHFGGVGIGIALSAIMVAMFASLGFGWQAGWIGAGLLSAVAFAAVSLLLAGGGGGSASSAAREPALAYTPALRRIVLAYGVFGFGYIVTATFLIAIMREGGADTRQEALVWLATGLAAFPSVYVWSFAARRFGLRPAFALGCLVEALGVAASVTIGGMAGPLIGGVLLGGTFVAVTAIGLQAGRTLAPSTPRRALAVMTAAFGTGQIIGPVAAGLVADWTGGFFWASMLATFALFAAAALALSSKAEQP